MEQQQQLFNDNVVTWASYSNTTCPTTFKQSSIVTDLSNYNFSPQIISEAERIYAIMRHNVRRGSVRKKLLFQLVHNAHLELDIPVDPNELGKIFGLDRGEIQKSFSLFSPLQTGYAPPTKNTTPLQYIPSFCTRLGLSTDITEQFERTSRAILEKDPTLLDEHPRTVASGLLRYCLTTHGLVFEDQTLIDNITGRSYVTVDPVFKRIISIDNS